MSLEAPRRYPARVTVKYEHTVSTLAEAWAFVMDRVDLVGDEPEICIHPEWACSHDLDPEAPEGEHESVRVFEVMVSGTRDEE